MTVEEAIKRFKPIVDNEAYTDNFQDACRMAIEALKKQEWISVKDRLPTEEDSTSGMVIAVENDKERRVKPWHWDIVVKYANEFTHWMPLPEPPKE